MIMFGSFLPGLGWLAPPKSIRAWEPTLLWNQLHSEPPPGARRGRSWCNRLWLLKNSLAELPPKMRRVRMPYKRFSPISDTFLVTPFGSVFRQIEFFNSHRRLHQLRAAGLPLAGVLGVMAIIIN